MMKLGYVSAILPDEPIDSLLRVANDCGYQCIEVMCWPRGEADRRYAGVTHVDVANLSDGEAQAIRGQFDAAGVAISGLGYYPNVLSADKAEASACTEHLRKVIAAAPKLGVSHVNTFIGRDPKQSVDANWQRVMALWPGLVQLAEDHGVRIGIENCPMFFSDDEWPGGKNLAVSPAIWRRLFNDIPSDAIGLNYDPSHLVWQCIDYTAPLHEFAGRLLHIHAKDVVIDRVKLNDVGILANPNDYHAPKLPGLGEIDWGRFCSALMDVGYDGPVCVEVEDRAYEPTTETRIAALRQSAIYLRNFLPS